MPHTETLTPHRMSVPENKNLPQTSEPDFRSLFEDAPVGIFHSTLEGRLLRANPAMAAMLGYASAEEMVTAVTDMGAQIYAEPNRRAKIVTTLLACDGLIQEVVLPCDAKTAVSVPST